MKTKEELFGDYPQSVLQRFKTYHKKNPQVFNRFSALAFQMKNTGRKVYSAETIINVMRWHTDLETNGEAFKINNDFKPLYARLLIYHYPEFDGFFKLKKVTSKGIKSEEQITRENEL